MGVVAAGTGITTGSGVGGLSAVLTVGTGVGGVFATVALVFALAYLDLLDVADGEYGGTRRLLVAIIAPLCLVFAGIVLFEAYGVVAG